MMIGAMTKERRNHPRYDLPKPASASTGDEVVEGVIRDISAGGVALRTDERLTIGQQINLEIDGMMGVTGHVVRSLEDGFVVALDLDDDDGANFVAEVLRIREEVGTDDS